ncbi:hypothetical protein Tco_0271922, partial [Tanacetum coccineum]
MGEPHRLLGLQVLTDTEVHQIETPKAMVKDRKPMMLMSILRYLKGKPSLGLWYPRESSFDLESYSDSDYAGANLDRKSTTG